MSLSPAEIAPVVPDALPGARVVVPEREKLSVPAAPFSPSERPADDTQGAIQGELARLRAAAR